MVLKELRAAVVIGVSVSDNCIFNVGRIQTQLLHPACNFFFNGIVENRIDHDDSLRCRDGPHRVFGLAEEMQVVEHLHGFGIPRGSIRRTCLTLSPALTAWSAGTCSASASATADSAALCRRSAQEVEQVLIII